MGFYGNKNIVANSSKSAFVFDRIYPNRRDMERSVNTDGVYIGRYVLIDYGVDGSSNENLYIPVFIKPDTTPLEFYTSAGFEEDTRIKEGEYRQNSEVRLGDIVYTKEYTSEPTADELEQMVKVFYVCTGTDPDTGYATFKYVTMETKNKYTQNYNLDLAEDNNNNGGRGFDGTVWQKVYISSDNSLGAKYVQIAELNSVVPTFNLTYDAPTLYPNTPHFDTNSTNLYYNLHVQPSWGLKVMAADANDKQDRQDQPPAKHKSTNITNYPSDTQLGYYRKYVDENGEEKEAFEFYRGAIYFNKDGFKSDKRSFASGIDDELTITPSGISRNKYNIHGQAQQAERPDTHEIKIMLPSLGNTISKIWDIIYGDEDANGKGSTTRNQDIAWNSTKGLRFVNQLDETYSVSTDKVETIAGCINSVHDLMGMIIETNPPAEAKNAESNKIYLKDGLFYMKGLSYKYNSLELDKDTDINFDEINGFNAYEPVALRDFSKGPYFQAQINPAINPEESEIIEDYLQATGNYIEGADYYSVTTEDVSFTDVYEPDKYYYQSEEDPTLWIKENSEKPQKGIAYYLIDTEVSQNPSMEKYFFNPNLFELEATETEEIKFFVLGKDDEGYDALIKLNKDSVYDFNSDYYKLDLKKLDVQQTIDSQTGRIVYVFPEVFENLEDYKVTFNTFKPENQYYLRREGNSLQAVELTSVDDIDYTQSYYIILSQSQSGNFYFPNTYYYKEELSENVCNYRISTEEHAFASRKYVTLTPFFIKEKFYEPNKYHYEISDGVYALDTSLTMKNTQYYIHNEIYVSKDELGLIPPGSIWNQDAVSIPDSITLATREEYYDWKELPGFARELNTIHGLILKINQLLLSGDTDTRDQATVQGAINKLNDIIYKISSLIPQQLVIVDSYGKIHSARKDDLQYFETTDCLTDQETSINIDNNNLTQSTKEILIEKQMQLETIAKNEEESEEEFENRKNILKEEIDAIKQELKPVVEVTVTADPSAPKVEVKHNFYPQNGKKQTFNFNSEENDFNNFIYHTPIVDNYGHSIGHNYTEVILPNNYHKITTNNAGADKITFNSNLKQSLTDLTASSVIDTINFETGNTWLSFDSDVDGKKITLYHNKTNAETLTDSVVNTQTPNFGDSVNISTFTFDDAGHLASAGIKTIQLPSLNVADSTGRKDVVTGFTISNEGAFTLQTEDVDQFILKNYTTATTKTSIDTNVTVAEGFAILSNSLASLDEKVNTNNANAQTTFLTKSDAESIYLAKSDAETIYLTKTNAESIYLTKTNAADTYLTPAMADSKYLAVSKESDFVSLTEYQAKIAELEGKITELTNKVNTAHPTE